MENNSSQKVFRLTAESLSHGIRTCETLPQYHMLICVDRAQSISDLVASLDTMLIQQKYAIAVIMQGACPGDTYIQFSGGSKISFCTYLDMNVYANQDIHSILIYNGIPHADAATEYAKSIIKPYSVDSHESIKETFASKFNAAIRRVRREIDTSAIDSLLEEI